MKRVLLLAFILISIVQTGLYAQTPADQSFNSAALGAVVSPYTLNGVTYTMQAPSGPTYMSIYNAQDFIISSGASDRILMYNNVDGNGSIENGIFVFSFKSATAFKLSSMQAAVGIENTTVFEGAQLYTIKGFLGGVEVISEGINFEVSDNAGSITYTKAVEPENWGGTLTFSSAWQNVDEVRFIINNTDNLPMLAIDDLNFEPAVGASNQAPTDIALSASSINENVAANSTVGTLSTTDPDAGNTFTYTLVSGTGSANNGAFTITGNTLSINASPDFENQNGYTIRVRSTDQGGLSYEKAFNITINNVNEAPNGIFLSQSSIAENSAANTTVATLSPADPDPGGSHSYSLVSGTGDTDNGSFNISGNALRFTGVPDFETRNSYTVRLRITDQGALTYEEAFTITVTNVEELPSTFTLSSLTFPENVTNGTVIGNFSATGGDNVGPSYLLIAGAGSDDNGLFSIVEDDTVTPSVFRLTWASGTAPDFEGAHSSSYNIRVLYDDGLGASIQRALTLTLLNVNEVPNDISLSVSSINENAAANTAIGTLSTTDPDAGNTFTYTLVSGSGDTDNGAFTIDGNSLRIINSPDFETKSSYSIRIRSTDQGNLNFEKTFTITINNLNETPTDIALSATATNENVAANATVGTFNTTDPDAGNTFTYTLVSGSGDTDNGAFTIDGNSLRIINSPDFETKSSYSIRIRSTDQGNLNFEKTFTITINNLNETPTDIALSATATNENVAANATVGTFNTTDPDAGSTFTYTLVSGSGDTDNGSFTISGGSLRITNSPDFEAKSSYSIRVRSTDQGNLNFEETFTITINNLNETPTDIALSATATNENVAANATVGTFSTTDPDAGSTFTYTLVSGSGDTDNAAFNTSGGSLRITNSPDFEAKSSYSIRIRSTDQGSLNFEKTFTITINNLNETPTDIVLSATATNENVAANATVGTFSTTDPDAGNTFTYTLVSGSGDTDNGSFTISGSSLRITNSPDFETKSSYSIRIRSTDQGNLNFEKTFTITVNDLTELVISPSSLPAATVAGSYSQTITASGGSVPYSYAVSSGSLPAGLSLSSATGTLSGTPTAGGSFNFTVMVTDNASVTGVRSYTLTVNAPVIAVSPSSLPAATAGTAYSQSIAASGGTATYTYAVTAGALPAGFTLSADGTLSGTATAGGTFNFAVTATDSSTGSGPYTGSTAYTLTVNAAAITLAPGSLPAADVAAAYSQTITATGGTAGYTYAVTAGALPSGLTLAANGTLSGTATAGGTFNFTITATDSSTGAGPYTGSQAYTFTVNAATIAVAPASLPAATIGAAYSQTITATGGTAGYTYAVTAGALPSGLTLAANGTLSGTATAGGTFNFTVTATDSSTGTGPYSGSRAYSLTVSAPTVVVAPATLPATTIGAAYSQAITATGGTSTYSHAVTAGTLPAGLTLAANGTLSGTATAGGTFNFTITATDSSTGSGPYSGSRAYSLTVNAATISLAPATLPAAAIGIAYSQSISVSGGTAGYTYAVTAGALPSGLTLSAAGTVSGTATAGGTFNFTITATDSSTGSGPYTGSRAYSLVVGAATISVAPATLAGTTVAATYNQTISASGGTAPYTYAITTGALPAGLSLATNGTLSGTATAGGSFNFTVTATDSSTGAGPYSGSRAYALTVSAPNLALAPAALPAATVGVAYSQSLTASGGTAAYSYAVTAGALPSGLTLAANGTVSGIPAVGGTFSFTITATDSSTGAGPYTGSRAYSLTISQGSQTITFAATASVSYGSADFDPGATSDNGTIPLTYSSSDNSIATIVGNKVHIVKAGTVTIHADQASNGSYQAAARKSQTLTIQPKTITLSLNAAPVITKVYDGTVLAGLAAANYTLNGVIGGDAVTVSGTAAYDTKNAGNGKTVTAGTFVLAGAQKDNYQLTTATAATTGIISAKALTITADDKSKIQGQPLPAFTASYTGFVAGESSAVLITQPTLSTTATAASPQGTYPIAVSGATAQNYSITFVPGILTVTPGSPTGITLAAQTVLENAAVSAPAGTLSSTSDDPAATFTYALVSGPGSTDNHLFAISGNQVLTAASLDYETKSSYSIRLKSTTQYGLSIEKEFTIALTDVNEAPTLAAISNQVFCLDQATRTINLSGITAGPESGQNLSLTVSSDNPAIFDQLSVGPLSGNTAVLSYRMLGAGSARVTVTVKDNGGTANGGTDTYARSFDLTANIVPGPSITSDLGLTISKGATATLTATGGGTYQWAAAQGIIGGTNSSVLTVRPTQTTTYQVTVTLASGCTGTASVTITVKEDYQAVDANNFMSPDGDGVNDRLVIKNLDMYPTNEVKIYDRAGRLLYTKKNYTDEWDGTFQGVPLADDTYYYVVDFGPGRLQLKGFVTIVRAK